MQKLPLGCATRGDPPLGSGPISELVLPTVNAESEADPGAQSQEEP